MDPRRRPRRRLATSLALALSVTAAVVASGGPAAPAAADDGEVAAADLELEMDAFRNQASRFVPITPVRALDSRIEASGYGKVYADSAISIDPVTGTGVAARAGVDADDITAVVANVTVVKAGGRGFATVWATGSRRLTTATNNAEFAGQNVGNLVIAPLGLERKISFYASTDAHVTVDVLGVFVSSGATRAGRFVQLGPVRHVDTRSTSVPAMSANETRTFDLTTSGVPADATGVVMNVTAVQSNGSGFYTVFPSEAARPTTANVNLVGRDAAAGNQVISGLTEGRIDVFTNVGSELVIDVTGYFTGPDATSAVDGLFVPFSPRRFLDTRLDGGDTGLNDGAKLTGDERFVLDVAGRGDIPEVGVGAVALNLTAVQPDSRGFVKAFARGAGAPATSSLNFVARNQTVPNHAITALGGAEGEVVLEPSVATHLVVDATGYFLDEDGVVPGVEGLPKTVDPGDFAPSDLGAAPAARPYDFLFDRAAYLATDQRPEPTVRARYSACLPIRYALNVDLADSSQIAEMIEAVEEVERTTGIDFIYAGVTSAGQNLDDDILLPERAEPDLPYRFLPPGADVVISLTTSRETSQVAGSVVGVGGGLRDPNTDRMFRGFVAVDVEQLSTSDARLATLTHELGHMMGLGHVSDFDPRTGGASTAFQGLDPKSGTWSDSVMREQLMYPTLNPSITSFAGGDARGFWELYGTQQCGSGRPAADAASSDVDEPADWADVEIVADS